MWKDEIVEEVREVRRRIGEEHGNDLRRLAEHLRREQASSGRQIISLEPRFD